MNRRDVLKTGAGSLTATLVPLQAQGLARGWDLAQLGQAAQVMQGWILDGRVKGASILVEQAQHKFEHNFGVATASQPVFLLASITKPMTAAAVMTLVDEGRISLGDPVRKFFPQFKGGGRESITLLNLLTHTSGLPDMLADDEALRERHASLSEFRDGALQAPLKFKPGSRYSYSSMGILLSAAIAQKISATPFARFVRERIFVPLGMTKTTLGLGGRAKSLTLPSQAAPANTEAGKKSWQSWNWNSGYWRNLGAPWGGALGPASDIVRFYREFLEKGGRILKPQTEQMMIVNQSPPGVKPSGIGFDLPPGVGSPGCGPRTFGHNGSTGTLSWCDPDTGTICVVLTTLYEAAVRPHPAQLVSDLVARAVATRP